MLNRIGGNARIDIWSILLSVFVPPRKHRAPFGLAVVCLVGVMIAVSLLLHAQSNRVMVIADPPMQARQMPASEQTMSKQHPRDSINASQALIRINQSDPGQYASQSEHDEWWGSTCSTASMTEVFGAYGYHYRITDVLHVERRIGAISAESGLLYAAGIDDTALRFGFLTTTMQSPSIADVVKVAKNGQPVIVNFPPHPRSVQAPDWTAGHFLVVTGGTASTVQLADSSTANHGAGLQNVSFAYFATYWRGYAKILQPSPSLVIGKPTLTPDFLNRVLAASHSPAAGKGQALYDLGVKYGIDPAFALAFFWHESAFGTQGEARTTLSLGNLRCIPDHACVDKDRGGYAAFSSWEEGFEAWYLLIRTLYVETWGLVTVEQIVPKYAPSADHNNEQAYIDSLKHALDTWRAGELKI